MTKIHKTLPVGRRIVSGSGGRHRWHSHSLLKGQSRKNKSLTSRTLHTLKSFIENTPLTGEAIWATLDMCSFCTNIPQEEEIEIVCHHYEEHCQSNLPIPTSYLENLMQLILRENQFKFNGKHYVQTHGTCNGHQNGGSCFLGHFHGSLW